MTSQPFSVLLIGAGNRGTEVYGEWIYANPQHLRITAIAEPNEKRRLSLAQRHNIPAERQFSSWEEAFGAEKIADVAIIATPDQAHTGPALSALNANYDVLLEKPIASNLADCIALVQAAEKSGRLLQIAHVLRYTQFFQQVHQIIKAGELGQIITVSHRENVSSWHMAHSYVRGNWRREDISSPMILTKSCHDLDILYWLLNSQVLNLSSIGGLRHFTSQNAPPGAPKRCLDGCPVAQSCPFFAPALYLDLEPIYHGLANAQDKLIRQAGKWIQRSPELVRLASKAIPPLRQLTDYQGWPRSVICEDPGNPKSIRQALETGPYGRCVYYCDNDVVDHQVVLMEMENGVSVSFTMHGHSHEEGRTIRIDGSEATLLGKFSWNQNFIHIQYHRNGRSRKIEMPNSLEQGSHGGGDNGLMQAFVNTLAGHPPNMLTDARSALVSHLLAFAAEEARLTGKVIHVPEFWEKAESETSCSH